MRTKHWLIAYDICDRKRLVQVEKYVSCYGWRVQKSVFESDVTEEVMDRIKLRLEQLIEKEDSIVILNICEKDWQNKECFGITSDMLEDKNNYLIL